MGRAITPLGGTWVRGTQAEWIVERTTNSAGKIGWLATFPNITITEAYAYPSDNSASLPWYTPNKDNITAVYDTMINAASQMLAYPILVDNDKVGAGWNSRIN